MRAECIFRKLNLGPHPSRVVKTSQIRRDTTIPDFVFKASLKSLSTQSRDRMSATRLHQNLTPVVSTAVSETVSVAPVAESVSTSVVSTVVVGVSLGLPLGNMDGSSGVGDVTSSTGVGTSDSRDGGG